MTTEPKPVPAKPLPLIDEDSAPFFKMAREHKFPLYRCGNCGAWYGLITDCFKCKKSNVALTPASGKGTIYSFVVYHQQYHPAWNSEIPYAVALVRTQEGPFVFGNVIEAKPADLKIGMPMEAVFDDVKDNIAVIRFRPGKA